MRGFASHVRAAKLVKKPMNPPITAPNPSPQFALVQKLVCVNDVKYRPALTNLSQLLNWVRVILSSTVQCLFYPLQLRQMMLQMHTDKFEPLACIQHPQARVLPFGVGRCISN